MPVMRLPALASIIGQWQFDIAGAAFFGGTRTGTTSPDLLGPRAGRVTMSRFPDRSVSARAGEMLASAAKAVANLR